MLAVAVAGAVGSGGRRRRRRGRHIGISAVVRVTFSLFIDDLGIRFGILYLDARVTSLSD